MACQDFFVFYFILKKMINDAKNYFALNIT